ncbi:adaptor protein MecA [Lachnoclostridium sp. Marseille-P6806]|uniref:adaptor protein MecA n=1 Tax=Lachnoclostridium sp. Marseille-P6806 TaxID=2364793 RepID=UPI001030EBD1|nr:adaptor protein MecA [Lachnoclostridium sp. Marseille-P6806]
MVVDLKFRKINETTINCIITQEDMRAHGLRIDDLFEKKEEAMEFLHQVLNEAARRVGFRATGGGTSMQMSVLPDQSLSLTISEQSHEQFDRMLGELQKKLGIVLTDKMRRDLSKLSDDERIEKLKEYAAHLMRTELGVPDPSAGTEAPVEDGGDEEAREKEDSGEEGTDASAGEPGAGEVPEPGEKMLSGVRDSQDSRGPHSGGALPGSGRAAAGPGRSTPAEEPAEQQLRDREFLFEFDSFGDVLRCARFISRQPVYAERGIEAELYAGGTAPRYWLILTKPEGEDSRFAKTVLSLNEYGRMLTSRPEVLAHIREQERCIRKDDTIGELAKI